MPSPTPTAILTAAVLAISACAPAVQEGSAPAAAPDARIGAAAAPPGAQVAMRAVAQDTVWIIANPVRADRRQDFERLMQRLHEAGMRVEEDGSLIRSTVLSSRSLLPSEPEQDGTYTYFILVDPRVPGADYSPGFVLNRLFPAEEAQEMARRFGESLAGPQRVWAVIQAHRSGCGTVTSCARGAWRNASRPRVLGSGALLGPAAGSASETSQAARPAPPEPRPGLRSAAIRLLRHPLRAWPRNVECPGPTLALSQGKPCRRRHASNRSTG
jgi:hypothetical protein